jgi:glycerophosphoryl diester phosphodiesterase
VHAIPTLEKTLSRYARRTRLLVEIKAREEPAWNLRLARAVADAVERNRATRSVFLLSFDGTVLDELERLAPRLPRVLNIEPPRSLTAPLRRRIPALAAISAGVRTLGRRFAADLRRTGCPLLVYTCNTPRRVALALECGASGVMSDRPAWLRERVSPREDEP